MAIINRTVAGGGVMALSRLETGIRARSPHLTDAQIRAEAEQIGVELMRGHRNLIDSLGPGQPVTPQAVAGYHIPVFEAHGLSAQRFGATPITGKASEAPVFAKAWMKCKN